MPDDIGDHSFESIDVGYEREFVNHARTTKKRPAFGWLELLIGSQDISIDPHELREALRQNPVMTAAHVLGQAVKYHNTTPRLPPRGAFTPCLVERHER